ncbi:unnamed protein product, partial [Didymodactylos carnosus]
DIDTEEEDYSKTGAALSDVEGDNDEETKRQVETGTGGQLIKEKEETFSKREKDHVIIIQVEEDEKKQQEKINMMKQELSSDESNMKQLIYCWRTTLTTKKII